MDAVAVGETTDHGIVLLEARGRPDRAGTWSIAAVLLGCLLAVPYVLARNPEGGLAENLLMLGASYLIVLVTVVLTIVPPRSRIQVTSTHVIKRRLLRRATVIPRSAIAEAVLTEDYSVPRLGGPRAFLLDGTGALLLHTHPVRCLADVTALAQIAPRVTHVPVLIPAEAAQRWPHMLPWSHTNPWAGVLLGVGIVLGMVVLGVLAAMIFG